MRISLESILCKENGPGSGQCHGDVFRGAIAKRTDYIFPGYKIGEGREVKAGTVVWFIERS